jgi:hypothetical protein
MIKLYTDFTQSYEHLMDSPIFSYLLHHNVEKIDEELIEEARRKIEERMSQ